MNKYNKNEIVLILVVLLTILQNFAPIGFIVYTMFTVKAIIGFYILYNLFTNKISLWTIVLIGSFALSIGKALKTLHWPGAGATLVSSFVILSLFTTLALIVEHRKKTIELDIYLLGGFGLIIFQSISTLLHIMGIVDFDGLNFFNYGIFGMFMTIVINKQSYGKMIDGVIIIFLAQSSIFVCNQFLTTLF